MSEKNSPDLIKQSTQDLFKHNPTQSSFPTQNPPNSELHPFLSNPHGIFLTHQQKIQATYNFQSLFRKKSHIYNLHKNKKKLANKNIKNDHIKQDDPDKDSKNVKKGHWTPQQNRKYHWFLELHNKHFILKHLRRTDKIFKAMSAFIGTRQAQQCRSHHQKMQKKYKNFYQIIVKLRMEFYGTCSTESVKSQMQENGYMKDGGKDLLIEESLLKSIENTRQNLQSESSSERENEKKIDEEDLMGMAGDEVNEEEGEEHKKEGNFFFGQNYENQLNYKLY